MKKIEDSIPEHKEEKNCKAKFHQIYCELCGWQSVLVEPPRWDASHKVIYGDIMCNKCHLVIGSVHYDLKDLPPK